MAEDKFKTIFGTWVNVSDVENPDELVDPTGYWDYVSSPPDDEDEEE